MLLNPDQLDESYIYKLLVGCVMPRPIAWVSTQNEEGLLNLAPFSFFNVASRYPPTLAISIGKAEQKEKKDTLRNIQESGELVVNVVSKDLLESMNITASEVPVNINEFELAGLDTKKSSRVNCPRVAQSRISMECVCKEIIPIGVDNLVIVEVVQFVISDEVIEEGKIQPNKLGSVGRMAGPIYCATDDLIKLDVPHPNSLIKR